ncbi:cysteine desulfurase family protein [Agromyces larvae]|uniref:Cysteine desulfurase n=1 Tax=Agromyces larvae TaxID=2929802 RepID=A0ABY4C5D9_9MICO|nr:cysteine desulfurase family protein [Agromyces larvae]UOE45647.1 cysteine desulfurase [Agromyces larvae]
MSAQAPGGRERVVFLDHAATTPVRREALEAMWPYLAGSFDGAFGNPSSRHRLGDEAARALAWARERVAAVAGVRPGDVVFTSGGTEADNLAVKGLALASPRGRHVVVSPIEHEAVLEAADALARLHGFEVSFVEVDERGRVTPEALRRVVRPDTTLVSVQLANNEVGTVQPVADLARIAHESGTLLHTDAVQAAGWLPLSLDELGADALSLAGHKVGAPKGTGALIVRGRLPLEPVLHGGGQERGRRSGTENVAGAVGFATALGLAEAERSDVSPRAAALAARLVARVTDEVPGAVLTGAAPEPGGATTDSVGATRLPGSVSFVFPGTAGEAVLLELEREGVICSSGSACAAGSDEPSHVLTAMGVAPEVAQTAVRFTLGADTTADDIEDAADAVARAVAAVRGIAAG